jgi:hypothetical protein
MRADSASPLSAWVVEPRYRRILSLIRKTVPVVAMEMSRPEEDGKSAIRFTRLPEEIAIALFQGTCAYCGAAPSTVIQQGGQPPANGGGRHRIYRTLVSGIDRIDSNLAYTPDNVVCCCKFCNFAKNSRTADEFREWVERAHAHLRSTEWRRVFAYVKPEVIDQVAPEISEGLRFFAHCTAPTD